MNNWSCLPNSLSLILGHPFDQIIDFIGHDGSEVARQGLKSPKDRRGFSIEELIDYCQSHGFTLTPISATPTIQVKSYCGNPVSIYKEPLKRFDTYLDKYDAILTGQLINGAMHAVPWINSRVLDKTITLNHFIIDTLTAWLLIKCS